MKHKFFIFPPNIDAERQGPPIQQWRLPSALFWVHRRMATRRLTKFWPKTSLFTPLVYSSLIIPIEFFTSYVFKKRFLLYTLLSISYLVAIASLTLYYSHRHKNTNRPSSNSTAHVPSNCRFTLFTSTFIIRWNTSIACGYLLQWNIKISYIFCIASLANMQPQARLHFTNRGLHISTATVFHLKHSWPGHQTSWV